MSSIDSLSPRILMPHGSKGKQMAKVDVMDKDKRPGKLIMSTRQRALGTY